MEILDLQPESKFVSILMMMLPKLASLDDGAPLSGAEYQQSPTNNVSFTMHCSGSPNTYFIVFPTMIILRKPRVF
jgi:hypothetical protein